MVFHCTYIYLFVKVYALTADAIHASLVYYEVEQPYIKALIKEWQLYLRIFEAKPRIKEIHLGGGTLLFFQLKI